MLGGAFRWSRLFARAQVFVFALLTTDSPGSVGKTKLIEVHLSLTVVSHGAFSALL